MKKQWSFVVVCCLFIVQLQAQCLDGNCWDGHGTFKYPSGAKYTGTFSKGKIHGKGILYFSNGNKYIGEWKNHYRDGQGKLIYTDGGEYTGQFKSSRFNGKGIFNYANGDRYDGNWEDDQASGRGTYQFKDGDRYEGEFKHGKFDGQGIMFYKDGAQYKGNWRNNRKNGQGVFVNASGKTTHGVWKDGSLNNTRQNTAIASTPSPSNSSSTTTHASVSAKLKNCNTSFCKNGKGEFLYRDGSRYVGTFLNGLPDGEGTCFYKNGDKYVGGWKNHAPHGKGIMYYRYGKVLGASWDKGRIIKTEYDVGNTVVDEHVEVDYNRDIKVWALIVGVARYEHMPTLKYTDDDAYQMYAFMKSPEGGALPDNQIRVLIDEDASRDNIIRAMRQMFLKADENDVVLFYFSGHGYDGSFIPADFDGYSNLLHHRTVKEILEQSKAKHKICFADACHSGSATSLASRAPSRTTDHYYRAFERSRGGIALLLSSKGEEFSLEDQGLRQGIFSHFLIRGLKGEADTNQNKIVSIQELYNFVHTSVKNYTANAQTPMLSGNYDANMPVAVIR